MLAGNAMLVAQKLVAEIDTLSRELFSLPILTNLLGESTRATAEVVEAHELFAREAHKQAGQEGTGINSAGIATVTPPAKKRAKKKSDKNSCTRIFIHNEEHSTMPKNDMGRRLSSLYQLVESETIYGHMEYLTTQLYDAQLLIFDGLVVTPRHSLATAITDINDTIEKSRQYVMQKYGWDMPIKMDSLDTFKSAHLTLLSGPKVFYSLPPLAQLIRQVIYELGETRGLKRFGRSLLGPSTKYEGFFEILRYEVKGAAGNVIGTSQEPMPLIHELLSKSPYALYAQGAFETKLADWFYESQDKRFEKIFMRSINMWLVRFEDGIADFNSADNVPIFNPWSYYKDTRTPIPMHFLAYPTCNYTQTCLHIREFEAGTRPDSPTPIFDNFINYQMPDKADVRCFRHLMGRFSLPLKDGWNVSCVITGPEQCGKSTMLNEMRYKSPLHSQTVKALSGKTSDKFPLGDLSNKLVLVSDEAESMIPKLGYDLLKSIISNGAFDADVKYSSDTNRPDGAGLQLFGVGNSHSLYDQVPSVDKAFAERVAHFKFDRLVNDQQRDPQLQDKLGTERGVHHIYNVTLYLGALRNKAKAAQFWHEVASENLRVNRDLAKLENDLCAQLLSGYSAFYRATPDSTAPPLFLEDLHTALTNYYIERKLDARKVPRNWMDAVKRLPYYSVKKIKVCNVCNTVTPSRRTCQGHYSAVNVTSRDMVFGMRLSHYPLGSAAGSRFDSADAADRKDPEPAMTQADPDVVGGETPYDEAPCGDLPTLLRQVCDANPDAMNRLSEISRMQLDASRGCARSHRRSLARTDIPALVSVSGPVIDRLMSNARALTSAVYAQQVVGGSAPVEIGDSYRPRGFM